MNKQVDREGLEIMSMEIVKYKLGKLNHYLPNRDPIVYEFGVYLAGKLPEQANPVDFYSLSELSTNEFISKKEKSPVSHKLNPQFLEAVVANITNAVCPADFARAVERIDKAFKR
jgi:hypothetical protein